MFRCSIFSSVRGAWSSSREDVCVGGILCHGRGDHALRHSELLEQGRERRAPGASQIGITSLCGRVVL